mgnify:CR=1 FL=1
MRLIEAVLDLAAAAGVDDVHIIAALGLHRSRLVDVSRVPDLVGGVESQATAQRVADDALVLVRDESGVLPLEPARP